ncbi:MAG: hypothetical protein KGJ78_00995 [Alphaproteobacteria bacterium]|nr:hypothetical protein [Alphaproteobacteria bacterium]
MLELALKVQQGRHCAIDCRMAGQVIAYQIALEPHDRATDMKGQMNPDRNQHVVIATPAMPTSGLLSVYLWWGGASGQNAPPVTYWGCDVSPF